jgi:hypothetical protein
MTHMGDLRGVTDQIESSLTIVVQRLCVQTERIGEEVDLKIEGGKGGQTKEFLIAQGVAIDKILVIQRALKDLDSQGGSEIEEGWDDIEVTDDQPSEHVQGSEVEPETGSDPDGADQERGG